MRTQNVAIQKPVGKIDSHRIAVIIPYFGKLPWYFKFFNLSCSYNPDIDFILITDMELPAELASNIVVVRSSLRELSARFSEKLGIEINLFRPYKLCDLRPAYGLVFSDLVAAYDFWGYGDIDLVLGDIRSLITGDILSRHEVVTIKKDYIAGFFSLFKNNEKVNTIFKRSKDYRKVFQEPADYCFDECNWEWEAIYKGKDVSKLNSVVDSITHVIKKAERAGEISVYWHHSMESHPGEAVWDHGTLRCKQNERAILCHFNFFKELDFKFVPNWKRVPERFYMNSFYFSRHAPASPAGRLVHGCLMATRFIKRLSKKLRQYLHYGFQYLRASTKIDVKAIRHPVGLKGNYRFQRSIVNLFIVDDCLHGTVDGQQFRLLHKGAGKFIGAKYKYERLVNVEVDFCFNGHASPYAFQLTCAGQNKKYTFFKVS